MDGTRIVFTEVYGRKALFYLDSEGPVRIRVIKEEKRLPVGSIVIGRVKKLMEGINACFVDIGDGNDYFLRLPNDLRKLKFTDLKEHSKVNCEDQILVRVSSEEVKLKAPCVSFKITLGSSYWAIEEGRGISFSSKISSEAKKKITLPQNINAFSSKYHIIVRTAAGLDSDTTELEKDLERTVARFEDILTKYGLYTCKSVLYRPESSLTVQLNDLIKYGADKLIYDLKEYEDEIREAAGRFGISCEFYEDSLLPLCKLYKLESAIDQTLAKRVYFGQGSFLMIEQCETLCAVDVNSGHRVRGEKEETVFAINMEAATEIFRQIKLRNISGMILIDFINMTDKGNVSALTGKIKELVKSDDVYCQYVDITGLGLVEITRKRVMMSFSEAWKRSD